MVGAKTLKTLEMETTQNPPWSNLLPDLISAIANFLSSNPIDIRNFRAVCKSWYSSSPPLSPLILSPNLPSYGWAIGLNSQVPVISATSVFLVSCREEQDTKSWLLFADQLNPGKIMIRQPFTNSYYQMPINFPRFLDVHKIRVDEVSRFYNFGFHPDGNVMAPYPLSLSTNKVVLNSDESIAVTLNGQLRLLRFGKFPFWEGGLELVQYAGGGGEGGVGDGCIDDVVCYKGKILSVDRVGRVYNVDCSKSESRVIVSSIAEVGRSRKRKRLVESNGELYLVVRGSVNGEESNGDDKFRVFKLNNKLNGWVQVSCLDGRVLFFGLEFSFSFSPQDLGGSFGTNCIVYTEGSFRGYDGRFDYDIMLSRTFEIGDPRVGVWHMEDPCHIDVIQSYPGYSEVIWPPPAWLWPNDVLERLGNLEAVVDGLLKSIPVQNSKVMPKENSPQEQVVATGDNSSHQDASRIQEEAHKIKENFNELRDVYNIFESNKTDKLYLSGKRRVTAILLRLEECTSEWYQKHQQLSADMNVVEWNVL